MRSWLLCIQRELKVRPSECCNISSRRKAAKVELYTSSWDKQLRTKFTVPAARSVWGFGPVLYNIKCANSKGGPD